MSEPMSSGEIEDVLSSIRRLVSEDLRPAPGRKRTGLPAQPEAGDAASHADEAKKLLLTPALRVVVDDNRGLADHPPPTDAAFVRTAAEVDPGKPDQTQPAPLKLDDSLRSDLPDRDSGGTTEGIAVAPDENTASAPDSGPAAGLGAALSSIGSAVDQNSDDWESETGDGGFASLAWKAPAWVEEAEIVSPATSPFVEAATEEALSPEAAEAAALAEIEAADREAGQASVQAASAGEAKACPPPQNEGSAAHAGMDDDGPDLFAGEEPFYDEALLRDLVRDIIREELSGTLGERITRNVRKLVRAEIARAMTVREFE
ncbi:MAG: hypothetical protein ACK4GW_04590 [Pseudorhodobacter sp.]